MAFDPGEILAPLDVREADQIVADTLALFAARRPEWVPRNASPEVVYMEAMSQAVAEVLNLGDQVIGGLAEALLANAYRVPRLPGSPATGTVTFTFDDTVTTVIPADTRLLMVDYGVELTVTADTTVTAATSATVPVATVEPTANVNGITSATIDLLTAVPNALSVALSSSMTGGASVEDSAAYLDRAAQRLARVSTSLVVPQHFESYVLESGYASNAAAIPAWDGVDTATSASDAGEVTVACYGLGGQVDSGIRAELASAMQAITAAGVTVHVNEATLVDIDVTVSVTADAGLDAEVVQADVVTALTDYLNPATWEFGATVRKTALIALIASVPGVAALDTPTLPADDETLLEVDEVANAGTLLVSVT